jgi:cytochrome c
MDSFELNKIAGAILGTALGVMTLGIVAEAIYDVPEPEQPGYVIAVAATGEDEGGPAQPIVAPIADRLQTAEVSAGQTVTAKCKACHTFDKGDPRRTPGPNLWGVVGGPMGHLEGFRYSNAMMAMHDKGETWTFENLDTFLAGPNKFIPDTAMKFAGLPDPKQRADVIAYLRTLSDNPVPLPAATAAGPAEGTAPAAGETPAGGEAPAEAPETAQ